MRVPEKRVGNKADENHESNTAPHEQQGALTCSPCRRSARTYRDNSQDVSNDKRRKTDKHRKKHHLAALPSAAKHVQEWEEKSYENKSASATKRATSCRTARRFLSC